jgi:uncharacterized membrane protein
VLLGIAIVALTGSIPLLLDGWPITMAWAIEATCLLGLGFAYRSEALRTTGTVLLVLPLLRALALDSRVDAQTYTLLLNSQGLSLLSVIVAMYIGAWCYGRSRRDAGEGAQVIGGVLAVGAHVLLWWLVTVEAWHFVGWGLRQPGDPQQYALSAVWSVYGAVLIGVGLALDRSAYRWTGIGLLGLTIVKVFLLDLSALDMVYRILALMGLGAVCLLVAFAYQKLVKEQR